MVRGGLTISKLIYTFSLLYLHPNKNDIPLNSQRRILYYDIHIIVDTGIEVYDKKGFNFFLNFR